VYNFKCTDFGDLLSVTPWDTVHVLLGKVWRRLGSVDLLFAVVKQCIPRVTVRGKKRMNWLSNETLKMPRCKRRTHRMVKKSGLVSLVMSNTTKLSVVKSEK